MTERLLGTGTDGFAILRVERDNQGSYYTSSEKHFLDIYEKERLENEPDVATKVSTVLLVEQTYTRHPDAKVDAPPEVKTNELAEGGEALSLPALMVRFPRMPEMWEAEKFQRLEADPTGGVSIERVSILWGGWVKERFGVDRNGEFEWKLADAMEDSDCLYLKVSSEHQVRWICLLPDTTRQIRARLLMKEFYLVAGSFDTREGAVVLAREIIAKGKDKKFYGFSPEVWSERTQAGKTRYLVVSGLTKDGLGRATSSKQEEILGLEIGVTSSSRFGERVFFE